MAVVGQDHISNLPWTRKQPWTETQREMESGSIFIGSVVSIWLEEYERVGMKSGQEFALHLLETHRLHCFSEFCSGIRRNTSPLNEDHADLCLYKPDACEIKSKMSCSANGASKAIDVSFSSSNCKKVSTTDIFDDSITLDASEDVNDDVGVKREDNLSLFEHIDEDVHINFEAVQKEGFEVTNHQDERGLLLFEEDGCFSYDEGIFIPIPETKEATISLEEECRCATNGNVPNFNELFTFDGLPPCKNWKNEKCFMEQCKATRVVPKTQIARYEVLPTNLKKPVISSRPLNSARPIVKQSSITPSKVRHMGMPTGNINDNESLNVQNPVVHDSSELHSNEDIEELHTQNSGAVRLPMKEATNNTQKSDASVFVGNRNSDSEINGKVVNIVQRNQTTPSGDKTGRKTQKENIYGEHLLHKDVNNSCVAQILKGSIDHFNIEKGNHLRKCINNLDLNVSPQNKEKCPALKNDIHQKIYDIEFNNKLDNFKEVNTDPKTGSKNASSPSSSNCGNSNPEISKYEECSIEDRLSIDSQILVGIFEKSTPEKVNELGNNLSADDLIGLNVNGSTILEETGFNSQKTNGVQLSIDSSVDDIPQTKRKIVSPFTSVSHFSEVCNSFSTSDNIKACSQDNAEVVQDEYFGSLPQNTSTSQLSGVGPQRENSIQTVTEKSDIPQDMMVMAEVLLEISRSRPKKCIEIGSDCLNDKSTSKNSNETCGMERLEQFGRRTLFKRRKAVSTTLYDSKINILKARCRTMPKTYSKNPKVKSSSGLLQSRYLQINNRSRVNKQLDTASRKNMNKREHECTRTGIKTCSGALPTENTNELTHQTTLSCSEDMSVGLNTDSQIDWEHSEIIVEPMNIEIREETILTTEFYPEHKELSARIRQIDDSQPLEKPKEIVGYMVTTVNGKKTYTCDFCGLSFPRLKDIETHIKESYDTSLVQTVSVVTNDSLDGDKDPRELIRKRSLLDRSFICEFLFCDQTFVSKKDYKKHVAEYHLPSSFSGTDRRKRTGHPSVCSTCGNKFSSKRRLHLHLKNCHPTKPTPVFQNRLKDKAKSFKPRKGKQTWSCKYCDLSFVIKRDLSKHVLDIHASLKPQIQRRLLKSHTCNFCQQNFSKRKLLVDHLQIDHYHPPGYAKPVPKDPKIKVARTKYCGYCELSFMDKKLLDNHLTEDHKITPKVKRSVSAKRQKLMHKCGSCDASFSERDSLQKHWRVDHKFFSINEHCQNEGPQTYQCSGCDFSSSDIELLVNHLSQLHNFQLVKISMNKKNSCCFCDQNFKNYVDLASHFKAIHFISVTSDENTDETSVLETKNTLRCKICDLDLSEDKTIEHMKSKHPTDKSVNKEKTTHNCKYCEQMFVTKKQLKLHIRELHVEREKTSSSQSTKRQKPEQVTHYCNFCELSFMKKRELKLHTKECHDKPKVKKMQRSYQCDFCEKSFPKKGLLSDHVKTDHPAVLNLSIVTGQNENGDPEILERDYEVIGDIQIKNRKIFTCDFCTFMFVKQKLLHAHIKECHKDCQYQCGVCGKLFTNKSRWNSHLKLHQPDPPFKCDCGKAFAFRYLLNAHVNQVHAEIKKHMCDYCGKTFSTARILRDHLFTHTKEQPFVCEVCNKGFTQAFNLKRHLWTHTGEKPYSCNICLKSFRGSTDLKRHSLIHVSQKPHRCELCDLSFRQLSHLNTHRKKQHKRLDPFLM